MLKSRSRAALLAVGVASVALAVGGCQKSWRVIIHYTPEDIAAGKTRLAYPNVRLPIFLHRLATEDQSENPHRRRNLINLALVAAVPLATGLTVYWIAAPRRRPEVTADYAESQGQSVPDGRDPPSP